MATHQQQLKLWLRQADRRFTSADILSRYVLCTQKLKGEYLVKLQMQVVKNTGETGYTELCAFMSARRPSIAH